MLQTINFNPLTLDCTKYVIFLPIFSYTIKKDPRKHPQMEKKERERGRDMGGCINTYRCTLRAECLKGVIYMIQQIIQKHIQQSFPSSCMMMCIMPNKWKKIFFTALVARVDLSIHGIFFFLFLHIYQKHKKECIFYRHAQTVDIKGNNFFPPLCDLSRLSNKNEWNVHK